MNRKDIILFHIDNLCYQLNEKVIQKNKIQNSLNEILKELKINNVIIQNKEHKLTLEKSHAYCLGCVYSEANQEYHTLEWSGVGACLK